MTDPDDLPPDDPDRSGDMPADLPDEPAEDLGDFA
ncbi:hypothetical protein J2Y58_004091 [Sphingomonas sp. BE138]|nr:hypothetical protein [Sphingomonas sp. BE138]